VNKHDTLLFPASLEKLAETADLLDLEIQNAYLTLDSGFDSRANTENIRSYRLEPVIKPNPRNIKSRKKRYKLQDQFGKVESIYKERIKLERIFAWKSKYLKLVIRYEKLQSTFMGFRYLACTMINLRSILGRREGNCI